MHPLTGIDHIWIPNYFGTKTIGRVVRKIDFGVIVLRMHSAPAAPCTTRTRAKTACSCVYYRLCFVNSHRDLRCTRQLACATRGPRGVAGAAWAAGVGGVGGRGGAWRRHEGRRVVNLVDRCGGQRHGHPCAAPARVHGYIGTWMHGCKGVWVHGLGAWVHGCMGACPICTRST